MNESIKRCIRKIPIVRELARCVYKILCDFNLYIHTSSKLDNISSCNNYIFYIGIAAHPNLGDLAQSVAIRKWLHKHYPDRIVIEIETNALVNTHFSLLKKLKLKFKNTDIIVFQSGYTTTDLGGYADEMHRAVMLLFPEAKMLMMPQTIFFKNNNNKLRTASIYNSMKHLLFLARDKVSYNMALQMFPDITVRLFPDIVTTLIGKYQFSYKREGIIFCCRNDLEQLYTEEEMGKLILRCKAFCPVQRTDTTKLQHVKSIIKYTEKYLEAEIDYYAHFKIVITDRFHGTIFALAANTPVIVIKTTDHKVSAGAEWFLDIYKGYVYVANSLEEAYTLAQSLYYQSFDYRLSSYFETKYYDKLPEIFETI